MSTADPLFLPDIDDEPLNPPPQDIDIDEIFKGLEDDDLFNVPAARPAFDIEAVKRKADAEYKRTAAKISAQRAILPSSSPPRDLGDGVDTVGGKGQTGTGKSSKDGEPKERRKPMRLDEARLIGPTGFPQLIQSTKNFRIKGKGHEVRQF
jgi:replication fork protection complex subunit Csm3/Swi3